MNMIKYILCALTTMLAISSCDTDIEQKTISKPFTYDANYYQNLRDYKARKHSIAFAWFAQYGTQHSAGVRFNGLPDSLDICSLWGGIPAKEDQQIWSELRFTQKVKGTKMIVVTIPTLEDGTDDLPYKMAYNEAMKLEGEAREAGLKKAVELYALHFVDEVFDNDLDGFEADLEQSGILAEGDYYNYFMDVLARYMGPNPGITKAERLALIEERYGKDVASTNHIADKLLCIDSPSIPTYRDIYSYLFLQTYTGGEEGKLPINANGDLLTYGWPEEKYVLCTNLGDNWKGKMEMMYEHAAFKPANGKMKGGFGTFFVQRDYLVHENNPEPYYRFRQCIQIQNPSIR